MKRVILVNPKSNNYENVRNYLKSKSISYRLITQGNSKKIIREGIVAGFQKFIICGGDGTINQFVNSLMTFPKTFRSRVEIGIIPCGRANDLARQLGISLDIERAFELLGRKRIRKIDLIKVNSIYILTGGGWGLPADVIAAMQRRPAWNLFLSKLVGSLAYYLFTLPFIIGKHEGVAAGGKRYMALCVQNQGFIGRRFAISPRSKNNDGFFELCHVEKGRGMFGDYSVLKSIMKGLYFNNNPEKIVSLKKASIHLDKSHLFMGDGEILLSGRDFTVTVVPRSLNFFY